MEKVKNIGHLVNLTLVHIMKMFLMVMEYSKMKIKHMKVSLKKEGKMELAT